MALDRNALLAKLNELKGNAARDDILWKPAEGENRIRIVPLATSPDNPFTELYFHYLGAKTYLSPLSFNEPDPIAEFADELRSGGGLTKDEWRETKKFVPQRRTFVPVIDRNKPNTGVRFWAFGKTVYSEILAVMADPEYGDITDPQTGRDIKVVFIPQEKSDTNFAKTAIRVAGNSSALTKDAGELQKWLNEQPDLMSLYKRLSYSDLKDVLDKFVNGTATAPTSRTIVGKSDESWDTPQEEVPSVAKSVVSKKSDRASVTEDFDKLFAK